jgi:hypothetical protein
MYTNTRAASTMAIKKPDKTIAATLAGFMEEDPAGDAAPNDEGLLDPSSEPVAELDDVLVICVAKPDICDVSGSSEDESCVVVTVVTTTVRKPGIDDTVVVCVVVSSSDVDDTPADVVAPARSSPGVKGCVSRRLKS